MGFFWFLLGVSVALMMVRLCAQVILSIRRSSARTWAQAIVRAQGRLDGERQAFLVEHPSRGDAVLPRLPEKGDG